MRRPRSEPLPPATRENWIALVLLGAIGWVPTIELTVHVRRRPAAGWIVGQFRTEDLLDGRMVENGALWDSTGALIAQSRQIGLVLPQSS